MSRRSRYNRHVKCLTFAVLAGLVLLGGCKRPVENKEAVRLAVLDHLAKRAGLNVASMQVDIVSVVFRQNEADATVAFRAKGSTGGPAMNMNYTLVKQGNGWVVKGRAELAPLPMAPPAKCLECLGEPRPAIHRSEASRRP